MENDLKALQKKNKSLAGSLAYWKKKYAALQASTNEALKKKERECHTLKVELEICRKTRFRAKTKYVNIQDADLGI